MWRRAIAAALVWAAVACTPATPNLSEVEARAILDRFASGQGPADLCQPEGRSLLRDAVRSYGRARADAGEPWPDIVNAVQGEGSLTQIEVLVLGALVVGFVEPSDLNGPSRILASHAARAFAADLSDARLAADVACPELVRMQQLAARLYIEDQRFQARLDRDTSGARARAERHARRMLQARDEMRRLAVAIETKVSAARER